MTHQGPKQSDHPLLLSGFLLSGVFCFVVAALFIFSGISGHGMDQPFWLLTSVLCR